VSWEHARRPRKGRDHQSVPRRENLVVEMRARTGGTRREKPIANARERRHDLVGRTVAATRDVLDRLRRIEKVPAAELPLRILRRVPVGLDTKSPPRDIRIISEQRGNLGIRPDVERSF
jgi:hypothetical protein